MASPRIDELKKRYDENPRRFFAPLANEYRKSGDLEQAISICQAHLGEQPNNMNGHVVYGQALFDANRLDEARTTFETALSLDPENLIALRHLGDIARLHGDGALARDWYQRVLDADPRNEEILGFIQDLGPVEPEAPPAEEPPPAAAEESPLAAMAQEVAAEAPPEPPPPPRMSVPRPRASMATPAPAATEAKTLEFTPPVLPSIAPTPAAGSPPVAPAKADAGASLLDVDFGTSDALADVDFAAPSGSPAPPPAPRRSAPRVSAARLTPVEPPPAANIDTFGEISIEAPASTPEPTPTPEFAPELPREEVPAMAAPPVPADPGMSWGLGEMDVDAPAPPLPTTPTPDATPAIAEAAVEAVAARAAEPMAIESLSFDPPPVHADPEPEAQPPAHETDFLFGDAPVAATPAETPEAFVTETMAELYLQQGFRAEALEVYRQLSVMHPDDEALKDRVRSLEGGGRSSLGMATPVAVEADPGAEAPPATTARSFFGALAQRKPVPSTPAFASPPVAASAPAGEPAAPSAGPGGTLDQLFGGGGVSASDDSLARALSEAASGAEVVVPPVKGRPTTQAPNELSLDSVFRADPPPRRSDPGARMSSKLRFDQFFAPAPGVSGPAAPAQPEQSPDASTDVPAAPADEAQFQSWLQGLKKQ